MSLTSYIISFFVGVIIGSVYHLIGVRSPAPPIIALLGLLGILLGESGLPILKEKFFPKTTKTEVRKIK